MNLLTVCLLIQLLVNGCSLQSVYVNEKLTSASVEHLPESEIVHSVFLIGDAGEPTLKRQEPNLAVLEHEASQHPEKNTIVFLGDNVYPDGIPKESDPDRSVTEQRLKEQKQVIERSGAFGVFIAGNHDWGKSHEAGIHHLEREEQLLASGGTSKIQMSPKGVEPGPAFFDIGDQVRLITMNTEWWLRDSATYIYPHSSGKSDTKMAVVDSLVRLIQTAGDRYVIVVGHHPISSHGQHAGFFDWRDHIFPLRNLASWLWIPTPIIGSSYPLLRDQGLSNQDESSTAYKEFIQKLDSAFTIASPLVYVAGHEHTLEVLKSSGKYMMLVSGFGTAQHDPSLTHGDNTLFAHRHPGFMRIDVLRDKRVRLSVIEPRESSTEDDEVYSMWLVGGIVLKH